MNKFGMGEMLGQLGSLLASGMFIWAIIQQYFPSNIQDFIHKYTKRYVTLFNPYIQITFNEFTNERFQRSEAYSAIETYLSITSFTQAKRLKADIIKNNTQPLLLSMDDYEEVSDDFNGVKVYWASGKYVHKSQTFSYFSPNTEERCCYKLTFHKQHRELIVGDYLKHVLKEGGDIKVRNRQRKLYTNNGSQWSHVVFEHPASFQTLALDPIRKQEIIDDLTTFSQAEDFYNRIGRGWKRGYLLYGPPGTGKSTMIAAMANYLIYDIYDLELTAVKNNTELRRLLIETSSKSIIVIEDIDCSMDLTGQRKKDSKEDESADNNDETKEPMKVNKYESKESKVTLSGLLNFVDGLWSACGGDRLIVFTTNHVEKLDPALIRRGRMDKHIELSYCGFEAFKILAKNYLYLESNELFDKVRVLLEEVEMTPADVAENLMPKTNPVDVERCLKSLIDALEKTKEDAIKKKFIVEKEGKQNDENKVVKVVENGSYDYV